MVRATRWVQASRRAASTTEKYIQPGRTVADASESIPRRPVCSGNSGYQVLVRPGATPFGRPPIRADHSTNHNDQPGHEEDGEGAVAAVTRTKSSPQSARPSTPSPTSSANSPVSRRPPRPRALTAAHWLTAAAISTQALEATAQSPEPKARITAATTTTASTAATPKATAPTTCCFRSMGAIVPETVRAARTDQAWCRRSGSPSSGSPESSRKRA